MLVTYVTEVGITRSRKSWTLGGGSTGRVGGCNDVEGQSGSNVS